MRYAVIGMGGVGGYFGAKLQRAGADVHFLVRHDMLTLRSTGLQIRSKDGDFHVPVQVYDQAAAMPPCDVVLVALKTTQNSQLLHLLPPMLAGEGIVVMAQNGLDPEADAAGVVGAQRVAGALCVLCAAKESPGVIRHWDQGSITLGAYAADASASTQTRLQKLCEDLRRAEVAANLSQDLRAARWLKLVWNVPFNGLSVLLGATTQKLVAHPHSRALVISLIHEVCLAARANGVWLPEGLVETTLQFTAGMPDYSTSMKLDFDAGRALEVDAIMGQPLRAALAAGVAVPHLTLLHAALQFLSPGPPA